MGLNSTYACAPGDSVNMYLFSFMMFTNVLIICKSLFAIIMTCRIPVMQENMAIVFASMSVNDVILAVILMCYQVSALQFHVLSSVTSKIFICLILGTCYGTVLISAMHLGVLALDRYIHIFHPLYYMRRVTKRRVFLALLCAWTIGLVTMSIPLLFYADDKYHEQCLLFHPPVVYFIVISFIFGVIFLAIFVSYFAIARLAFKRTKAAKDRGMSINNIEGTSVHRINRTSGMRSVKFFIIMFGVFAFFSIPSVVKTWMGYFVSIDDNVHIILFFSIPFFAFFNVVFYVKVSRDFSLFIQSTFCIVWKLCCIRNH